MISIVYQSRGNSLKLLNCILPISILYHYFVRLSDISVHGHNLLVFNIWMCTLAQRLRVLKQYELLHYANFFIVINNINMYYWVEIFSLLLRVIRVILLYGALWFLYKVIVILLYGLLISDYDFVHYVKHLLADRHNPFKQSIL